MLSALARLKSATAGELMEHTGIPSSALYRHLARLRDADLVSMHQNRYYAGSATIALAESYRKEHLDRSRVSAVLRDLADETGELAAYLVPNDLVMLCVAAAEGPGVVRCSYSPGNSAPLLRGASARAALAWLPNDRVQDVLTRQGLHDHEQQALRDQLASVRHRGYAVSLSEVDPDVWGVSFPILTADGSLTGVLSTMAPRFRVRNQGSSLVRVTAVAAAALHSSGTDHSAGAVAAC